MGHSHAGSTRTASIGRLESINSSRGGLPKTSMVDALVTESGLDSDRQQDGRLHGGRDRAIVLFSLERIRALQAEGHPIDVGTTGENLTVSGLDWTAIVPGATLTIGPVRLLITQYISPCGNVGESFLRHDFTRISQKVNPGWSRVAARVLAEGLVTVGDQVQHS